MAWYRCGGGIPSSLKTDMNAVYNKKFGTSTTYDPSVWASTANLMGPLPEKTASGAVASITDGADAVPIKSWEVKIAPTLTGKSAVECTQTKKNLIDNSAAAWENGTINASGNNASGTGTRTAGYYELKGGATITVSGIVAPSTTSDFRIFYYDENKDFLSYRNYSASYIVPDDVRYIRIRNVSVADISALQIEYGATATTYEAYTAPTVSTVSLGRTIYGGEADVVNGTGTDAYHAPVTFDGSSDENWKKHNSIASWFYIDFPFSGAYSNNSEYDFITSSWGTQRPYSNVSSLVNGQFAYGEIDRLVIKNTDCTEVEDFKTWLSNNPITMAYKLATPTDFTFAPITPTPETPSSHVANFWADTGDSSVTYRADIDLLLGGN